MRRGRGGRPDLLRHHRRARRSASRSGALGPGARRLAPDFWTIAMRRANADGPGRLAPCRCSACRQSVCRAWYAAWCAEAAARGAAQRLVSARKRMRVNALAPGAGDRSQSHDRRQDLSARALPGSTAATRPAASSLPQGGQARVVPSPRPNALDRAPRRHDAAGTRRDGGRNHPARRRRLADLSTLTTLYEARRGVF